MENTIDIERRIKHAVERITPDVIDDILIKCDKEQNKTPHSYQHEQHVGDTSDQTKTMPSAWRLRAVGIVGTLAAVLVFVFGGGALIRYISDSQLYAVLTLDANPSVTLSVNRVNRVINAIANNDDAITVMDGMDLKGTTVDVAVNALVGSMLKYGYIRGNANTVLLSVDGDKNLTLQSTLTQSISRQLNVINGAVISQKLQNDETLEALADENGISFGKASLVQKILNENSHLLFSDLAKLSVNELNLLVSTKRIAAEGMEAEGNASETAYIGMDNALNIALSHAGVNGSDIFEYSSEFDCDDGIMIYDVDFCCDDVEYEYEIDAKTGDIIEYDRDKARSWQKGVSEHEQSGDVDFGNNKGAADAVDGTGDGNAQVTAPTADTASSGNVVSGGTIPAAGTEFIGEDAAKAIALAHSGTDGSFKNIDTELDKEDGIYIYEVEFDAGSTEYDYEIDALTGEILSHDAENE